MSRVPAMYYHIWVVFRCGLWSLPFAWFAAHSGKINSTYILRVRSH